MAREYWYMQLRRWLMRSSVKSLIRSSLVAKNVCYNGVNRAPRAAASEHIEIVHLLQSPHLRCRSCQRGSGAPPLATPFISWLHLSPSPRDLPGVGEIGR